jgi:cell division protein FtsW
MEAMPSRVGADKWMFFVTVLLIVAGLVMVFSASAIVAQEKFHSPYTFVGKQAIWALAGFLVLVLLMNLKYELYNSAAFVFTALGVSTFLLVLVYFFRNSHATHRWIRFGDFFTFQPSEIAKLTMVLFLAWFLHTRLDRIADWRRTLLVGAVVPLLFIALVVCQPDLGTALVLAGVALAMFFLAGLEWRYLVVAFGLALPVVAGLLFFVPWRWRRILAFMNPEADPQGIGFHINQSLIAVGTGGLTGRGYMEGVQKLFYLPEGHTDFIFANIAEELGFVGSIALVVAFAVFGWRGMRTVFRCKDNFGKLMAFGITTTIVLQAFFNISVVLSLLPTKGIPLPLISSGGTSLFCTLASIGILLNISRTAD